MPSRPDDAQTRHLLALRSMLVDAVSYARRTSTLQRSTATVLLDGVVERTLHLIAVDRGLQVPRNNFDALLDRVVDYLGPGQQPPRLPDIRQLHRARNSAQHEGLAPDRDQLAPWASAVGVFVRHLVEEHFARDLDRVALSDPVADDELRRDLEEAARALAERRAADSVQASRFAVDKADSEWQELHGSPRYTRLSGLLGGSFTEPLDGEVRAIERRQRLAAFADSAAEAVWFDRLSGEDPDHLDLDDAERALAFAVSWVLAYEAAKESWTPDRRARANRRARLVRGDLGPATVGSVVRVELTGEGVDLTVRVADVPGEDFDAWEHTVNTMLGEESIAAGSGWRLHADGTAQINLRNAAELEQQIAVLAGVLGRAEVRLQADRGADARRQHAEADGAAAFSRDFAALGPLPSWVTAVRREAMSRRGPAVVLTLDELADTAGSAPDARGIADLAREHEQVAECYWIGDRTYAMEPALTAAQAHELLWSLDDSIRELVRQRVEEDARLRGAEAELVRRAQESIQLHRP